jgi:hypothetical protein
MSHTQHSLDKCEHPPDEDSMREIVSSLIWDGNYERAYQLAMTMYEWTSNKQEHDFISFYWLGMQSALHSVRSGARIRAIDQELSILKGRIFS